MKERTFQGVSASHIVTLPEGRASQAACRVDGGHPHAHDTTLQCGQLVAHGDDDIAVLAVSADQLTKDMDGTVCRCTAQDKSGCNSNIETTFTLDVTYAPVVTFDPDPTHSMLNKGEAVNLTCSAQGNPTPTLLVLTRERTKEVLTTTQSAQLSFTIRDVDCLDSGVYRCTGQNSQGQAGDELRLGVRCPQQLVNFPNSTLQVAAALGEPAQIFLEVFGYPEPITLTLRRQEDSTGLRLSPRYTVEYSTTVSPFGLVNVTIFNLAETDFTLYTLIVDNGVEKGLIYNFSLVKESSGGQRSVNSAAIVIGVIAVVIIVALIAFILFLVRQHRNQHATELSGELATVQAESEQYDTINDVAADIAGPSNPSSP
ncbi:cell adhesion molecule 3 [Elysia marginata]|uniref:Cell adhesion molecule 3 n=1 Tax=Elysia marginata TaxID=1093978 RepID=A0AAV4G6J1_9GAST|nr:cell adhesion molecule 3 [Elysia marginata]